MDLPTIEDLRLRLDYAPETGALIWRVRGPEQFQHCKYPNQAAATWNANFSGREAGTTALSGYRMVKIFDRNLLAHRVVWAMHYGAWPESEIDHVNRDRSDNRISNLRDIDHRVNQRNRSKNANNASGITGVCWDTRGRRWRAFIKANGRGAHLGYHTCLGRAITARRAAERDLGFHPNHGKRMPA